MADEERSVGGDKPRSNIFTILIAVTTIAYIIALSLVIMELQEPKNFRYQVFGSQEHPGK